MRDCTNVRALASVYLDAKRAVIEAGCAWEIDWQASGKLDRVTEPVFLREAAWVILCAGMKETVVRSRFAQVSDAFLGWCSARGIVEARRACRRRALSAFKNVRKINAILSVSDRVAALSIDWIRTQVFEQGVKYLQRLPFVGPVTSFHLAKNLGLQLAKPDRHMVRIAGTFGFSSAQSMCEAIASEVCDPVAVIDVVLWRYATLHSDYRDRLTRLHRDILITSQ